MRAVIAGCALLLLGSAAAQARSPYDDGSPPPPPYDDGFDGAAPSPRPHHLRCRTVRDDVGPHRVCRPDF